MRKNGFTLLELLVVVAIVAMLAGAMVPLFTDTRHKARVAKALADMDAIKKAAHMLYRDTGQWPCAGPPQGAQTTNGCTDGHGLVDDEDCFGGTISGWKGPYLDDWKLDPWGAEYDIFINTFVILKLKSCGPDNDRWTSGDNIYLMITPDCSK